MKISIVTPMYNESAVVKFFLEKVSTELIATKSEYEIICINDGSIDNTLDTLKALKHDFPEIRIVNLSRNFGKESALTAGIDFATGDVIIPMDADLQDPPELIHEMLKKYYEGFDVVLAKRKNRSSDTRLKRTTAGLFYRLISSISNVKIQENVGDYRLMSRRVVDVLKQLKETQRFMKGIFAWPGFSTTIVEYVRTPRVAGNTSFNGLALVNLAIEGITSFSVAPLKLAMMLGFLVSAFAFVYASIIASKTLFYGIEVPGYASLMVVVLFMSGLQFILIGIMGEYIGRVYMESKNRPIYIIEKEY